MEHDTSKKYGIHYVQQDLAYGLFAIIRMTWRYDSQIDTVDEVNLVDEGDETIRSFGELMEKAILGGAEISIICPYDPESIGLHA